MWAEQSHVGGNVGCSGHLFAFRIITIRTRDAKEVKKGCLGTDLGREEGGV